ncbi:MAG: IPT/TIG domain-containing protein, partial [Candidatus Hydrogenedentota bacterium]
MAQRNTTGMLILLMVGTMIMGGCGWISGGDDPAGAPSSSAGSQSSAGAGLRAITKAVYTHLEQFKLVELDPVRGPVIGGTPVTLLGNFRVSNAIYSLYEANASHNVTFDGNNATFIPNAVGQFITADTMYVSTPPGLIPSLVDVSVTSAIYGTSTLYDGFRYFGGFELIRIYPDQGPTSGFQSIQVMVNVPLTTPVTSLLVAESLYSVEIDGNAAIWWSSTPLIGINSIYEGYNVYFNMLTPPGILGIKDAALIDVASIE